MKIIIYAHTCKANNKQYVGLTRRSLEERWFSTVKQSKKKKYNRRKFKEPTTLNKAIEFYGDDQWDHRVLEEHDDLITALFSEQNWIRTLKTNQFEFGYNRSVGGEIPPGIRIDELIDDLRKIQLL